MRRRRRAFLDTDIGAIVRAALSRAFEPTGVDTTRGVDELCHSLSHAASELVVEVLQACASESDASRIWQSCQLLVRAMLGLPMPAESPMSAFATPSNADGEGVDGVFEATAQWFVAHENDAVLVVAAALPLHWFDSVDDDPTVVQHAAQRQQQQQQQQRQSDGHDAAAATVIGRVWCPAVDDGASPPLLMHNHAGWWKWCSVLRYDADAEAFAIALTGPPLYGNVPHGAHSAAAVAAAPVSVAGSGSGVVAMETPERDATRVHVVSRTDVCLGSTDPVAFAERLVKAYELRVAVARGFVSAVVASSLPVLHPLPSLMRSQVGWIDAVWRARCAGCVAAPVAPSCRAMESDCVCLCMRVCVVFVYHQLNRIESMVRRSVAVRLSGRSATALLAAASEDFCHTSSLLRLQFLTGALPVPPETLLP
jgi:hypothetical protein